jgi:hypothetical protein
MYSNQVIGKKLAPLLEKLINLKVLGSLEIRQLHGLAPPSGVRKTEWFCLFGPPSACRSFVRGYSCVNYDKISQYRREFNIDISKEEELEDQLYVDFLSRNYSDFDCARAVCYETKANASLLKPNIEYLALVPIIHPKDIKTVKDYLRQLSTLYPHKDLLNSFRNLLCDDGVRFFACAAHFETHIVLKGDKIKAKAQNFENNRQLLLSDDKEIANSQPILKRFTGHGHLKVPDIEPVRHRVKECLDFFVKLNHRWEKNLSLSGIIPNSNKSSWNTRLMHSRDLFEANSVSEVSTSSVAANSEPTPEVEASKQNIQGSHNNPEGATLAVNLTTNQGANINVAQW